MKQSIFEIGQEEKISRVFTEKDVKIFADISGDQNPIHVDPVYAESTYFGCRIVHGMLVASLISSVLGNKLPGPGSIYIHQDISFKAPVYIGDQITACVKVLDWDQNKGRLRLSTIVTNQNEDIVISGNARLVMASYL